MSILAAADIKALPPAASARPPEHGTGQHDQQEGGTADSIDSTARLAAQQVVVQVYEPLDGTQRAGEGVAQVFPRVGIEAAFDSCVVTRKGDAYWQARIVDFPYFLDAVSRVAAGDRRAQRFSRESCFFHGDESRRRPPAAELAPHDHGTAGQ